MEIGIVSRVVYPLHGFGGMEKHVYYLVKGLAERGHQVELFCMKTDESIPEELQHENIKFTFVPYREFSIGRLSYISFIINLFRHFSDLNRKDIVHFQGMTAGMAYAQIGSSPKVFTPHGMEQFKHHLKHLLFPFNLMEKLAAQRASKIIALSSGNREEAERFLHVGEDKIAEIPNGVDAEFFKPSDTSELEEKYDLEENVVVAVSRLVKYKGHGVLVKAVNQMENTSLVIAGDGPFKEELEEVAGEDVHFAGRVDEEMLPVYYSLGDVFSLPTFGEGLPLSILESLACGTPVVATKVGSIPDVITSDIGTLVEPKDVEDLKNGLEDVLDRTSEEMETRCREFVVENYSWDSVVRQTEELYREISS